MEFILKLFSRLKSYDKASIFETTFSYIHALGLVRVQFFIREESFTVYFF